MNTIYAPNLPTPPKRFTRSMRPLSHDMIFKVWGADSFRCPCCKAPMKLIDAVKRPEKIEFSRVSQICGKASPSTRFHFLSTSNNTEGSETFWTEAQP